MLGYFFIFKITEVVYHLTVDVEQFAVVLLNGLHTLFIS